MNHCYARNTSVLAFGLAFVGNLESLEGQQLVYQNETVLVYSVPTGMTREAAGPLAREIALDVLEGARIKLVGNAVSALGGTIAGILYSVIQQVPTVGNPTEVAFDVVSESVPLVARTTFGISLLLDTGDCVRGAAVTLERPKRFGRWDSIQRVTILTEDETWAVLRRLPNTRMLIVTGLLLTAPDTRGTYRLAVSAGCTTGTWSKLIEVMEWY